MGITINNMTLVQVGQAVKTESLFLKLSKLISALVVAITAIVCMSYFVVGHKNVNALQSNCTSLLAENLQVYCTNSTLYDFNFQDGPFTDDEEAKDKFVPLTRLRSKKLAEAEAAGDPLFIINQKIESIIVESIFYLF